MWLSDSVLAGMDRVLGSVSRKKRGKKKGRKIGRKKEKKEEKKAYK